MGRGKIAVIGGGIVGLLTAYEALERGYEVVVYEARKPGYGASGHNAGVIHVIQQPFNSVKSKLARLGNKLYRGLSERMGFRLREVEALLVYTSPLERVYALIASIYLRRVLQGFKVRLVDKAYIYDACPEATRAIKGGIAVSGYKTVVPSEVLEAIAGRLEEAGVELRRGWRVESIKTGKDTVEVESRSVDEYTGVIIAAGGDSARLAERAGLKPPRQEYAKGVMVESSLECNSIIAPLRSRYRGEHTKGGAVIPWPDNRVIIGPTFKKTNNPWDTSISTNDVEEVVERFKWLVGDITVRRAYGGTRIINVPRDDFIIQQSKRIIALYGIDSPGFTAAPALAKLVVDKLPRH
ncbi:MAG: FAD-binding oxidoreductase [Desulfurococcales archaeon]|nr:FAD-binding oxidoreductase [Desulfurococcales archaeon]